MSLLRQTISEDYLLAVQQGKIPNQEVIWKFGFSDVNVTSGFNTVRNGVSGLYDYTIGYGANADTIIATSSNTTDNGLDITISGLDATGAKQTVETTINTTTTETWSRIFRAYNSNGTDFLGDITISDTTTSTNISYIAAEDQQTLQSFYTIPLGYTGYLFRGESAVGQGKETEITFSVRANGSVFRTVEKLVLFEDTFKTERPYNPLPELTDVEVRCKPSSINTLVTASFGILLVKN